ncbi:MAG: 16S rRNA (guanine(527)-N(7))-methyltransferase RsmG [Magnetovibrio sp.]|nr:16S rRNA (guanine(527)-N(7))-methyltransferase RsmG [Magnetovibrio sp.]|tara:strand:- start:2186 stop:2806 length:621 start_codon:yes stop_codon:yes gene_type:complete
MFHVKQFQEATNANDEALQRLLVYSELLEKWQKKINLVSSSSIVELWKRHMLDSAQLLPLLPRQGCSILDFGSGAGFPGLVLALMGELQVTLVESDQRKCVFLSEVIRKTRVVASVRVQNCRIENLPSGKVDVVVSRGLAPLEKLLVLAERFLRSDSICLFLKGKKVDEELKEIQKNWYMKATKFQSRSDPCGIILKIEHVMRRGL